MLTLIGTSRFHRSWNHDFEPLYTTTMPSDILDPSALLSLIPTFLPPSSKVLKTAHDGIAALLHTSFSALGFRLTSVDDASSIATLGNVLPVEWNRNGPGHYTFKYRHDQSSLEYVVKISKMGTRTLINAIAIEVRP